MNIKKIAGSLLIAVTAFTANAQKYQDFEFNEKVEFSKDSLSHIEEEAIIKRTQSFEYIVTAQEEYQYEYNYSARWLGSDKAIEENNKIYLSAPDDGSVVFQKARVISPEGKVTELNSDDILEGVYEEDGDEVKYYYFAVEGLEKGSIIEECSYKKYGSNYYGTKVYFQGSEARFNQTFELICPPHLWFEFKSLNGAPEIEKDTTLEDENRWFLTIDTVEKIKSQPYLYTQVVKQALLYKLNRNSAQNRGDITSYSRAADFVYQSTHQELGKKTAKAIDKLYKGLDIDGLDTEGKIRAIEEYIKSNYQVINASVPSLEDLDFILENKAMSPKGSVKFHIQFFERAGIENHIVLTTDRSEIRFDEEFEAYLFLLKYLFYFPELETYIAPSEQYSRWEYIPDTWAHNYGLFIKSMNVGGVSAVLGEIKFIEALPYTKSTDKMYIDVDFSEDIQYPTVDLRKEMFGYTAIYLQPYVFRFDEQALTNFKSSMSQMVSEDLDGIEVNLENIEENDFSRKPYIFSFTTNEHNFVEKAGDDYLFKLGELIGPQSEMYQEEERVYDIEADHTRHYYREITFNVPEGYQIKNLDDVKMDHQYEMDGETRILFTSKVIEENGKYKVVSEEYYGQVVWPSEKYEQYREVINAAADFNKIVLVLEKK